MIALRLDRRLSARVDPSDVLQETLAEAHRNCPSISAPSRSRFIPGCDGWPGKRSCTCIVSTSWLKRGRSRARKASSAPLPDESVLDLAERLVAKGSSAAQKMIQKELKASVQAALAQLDARDREVLVLRFLEQLSIEEAAAVLEISQEAVKSRQRRALERFSELSTDTISGDLT